MKLASKILIAQALLGCEIPPPRPPPPLPELPGVACPEGMVGLVGGAFVPVNLKVEVTVASFCLDRSEVTVNRYAACVKAGACAAEPLGSFSADGKSSTADPECNAGNSERGNHPINCLDWERAAAFCAAQGGRLPTEEEWEWAARGGPRGTFYPWGNEYDRNPPPPGERVCWLRGSHFAGTCAVGSFPAGDSPHGIHDLAGNVWEWTASTYAGRQRVIRGGSWILSALSYMNAKSRYGYAPEVRDSDLGFRCARSIP